VWNLVINKWCAVELNKTQYRYFTQVHRLRERDTDQSLIDSDLQLFMLLYLASLHVFEEVCLRDNNYYEYLNKIHSVR